MTVIDFAKELGIKPKTGKSRIKGWTTIGCDQITKKKFLAIQKLHDIPSTDLTLNFLMGIYLKTERE